MISSYLIIAAVLIRVVLLIILGNSLKFAISSYRGYHQNSVFLLMILVLITLIFTIAGIILTLIGIHEWVSLLDGMQGIIIGFIIILFLDAYESTHTNPVKISLATYLATTSLYFFLLLGSGKDELITSLIRNVNLPVIIVPAYFVFILMTSRSSLNRMKLYATDYQKRKMDGLLQFIYTTFGGITLANAVGQTVLFGEFNHQTTSQYIFYVILMQLFFIFAYLRLNSTLLKDNNPGVFQPQKIDKIILISSFGTPVYTKEINLEVQRIDDTLFTGALTAINAVLKEATNVVGDLRLIQLDDQNLMISNTPKFTLVVFTYHTTKFLNEATHKIASNLVKILENETFTQVLENETSDKVDKLIFQYLGV